MTTIAIPRSGGTSTGLSGTLDLARRGFASLARSYRIRQDRRALQSMPDHMLRDIGVSRSEIDSVLRYGRSPGC
jgi:uncharacterized protein YjiS (DUF1127 family)